MPKSSKKPKKPAAAATTARSNSADDGEVAYNGSQFSGAILVCERPRVIRRTVDVDEMVAAEGGSHLKTVYDAVRSRRGALQSLVIKKPDPVTPVVACSYDRSCETVTYLWNLDHKKRPILGKEKKDKYRDKYLFKPATLTPAEKRRRAKEHKEQEKRNAEIKAEREAQAQMARAPCDCRAQRGGH